MKLQKLLYFAHGLHLALRGMPLIREPVEAWKYGPVFPSLYHKFKIFFSGPVPINHPYKDSGDVLAADSKAIIRRTYDVFGQLGAVALANLSHEEGSPWSVVYKAPSGSPYISSQAMRVYFSRRFLKPAAA